VTGVARNIEIKARIGDLDAVRARALSVASGASEHLEQRDTFFVVPDGRLKVREFADGSGELIAYHRRDDSGPKESRYTRCRVERARDLVEALAMVLAVRGVVAKRREVFMVDRTRVHLDQVERLGSFVELEVVLAGEEDAGIGERVARELLDALAIPPSALVAGAYIDLLEAARV